MSEILSESGQKKLVEDLQLIIEINKERANQMARQITINTYWNIGKRIAEENLSENANYKSIILQSISTELGLKISVINRCLQFFAIYPELPEESNLSWSHYRELLTVKDEDLRSILQQEAESQNWTKDQLIANIKNKKEEPKLAQNTKLKRPTNPTYIYKATIKDVVDGDTLLLLFDLGFLTFREQRVRLAGINCPEISQKAGEDAKNFVLKKLAMAEFVMVKTHKIDIYGRYLGHIFYDPTNQKNKDEIFNSGNYLNQEILDEDLAEVMLF